MQRGVGEVVGIILKDGYQWGAISGFRYPSPVLEVDLGTVMP